MNPEVAYEDKNLLVLNKPAGLLVHGTAKSSEPTLADWLLKNYPEVAGVGDDKKTRPGIVHRLDKETSGVIVIARNQPTFEYLKKQFQEHEIKKTYLALVWGKVAQKSGRIEKPIGIATGSVKRTTRIERAKMVKEAITSYKVIKFIRSKAGEFTLLEVEPKTGRTHQIRVHLASIGHPIVGDAIYGKNRPMPAGLKRQFLHADSIEFTLPNNSRLKVSADLPPELDLKQFSPEDSQ